MRRVFCAIAAFLYVGMPIAQAKAPEPLPSQTYSHPTTDEADLASHRHYRNKDGQDVHAPSKSKAGKAPDGASAQCRDGSYSFSQHRRGTCSRHGGIAQWLP